VIHAEVAKSTLEAYGADAAILGGTLDERPDFLDRSIDLMVKRADLERARDILGPEERFSL
jgi:hypothetical protein